MFHFLSISMQMSKRVSGARTNAAGKREGNRAAVQDRLLDAAEVLFAENGFHGVAVRDIVTRAGTRLADINDRFGGKDELFKAVISRRAGTINADRDHQLSKLPGKGTPKRRIRTLVEAFAKPLLVRSRESEGWRNYLRLVAQINMTRSGVLLLVANQFNPVAVRFVEQIHLIFPDLPQRQLLNAYQFMVASSLTVFSDNYRINSLSGDALQSSDFEPGYSDMVEFVSGGILQIASAPLPGHAAIPRGLSS